MTVIRCHLRFSVQFLEIYQVLRNMFNLVLKKMKTPTVLLYPRDLKSISCFVVFVWASCSSLTAMAMSL
uniref:Uncharacterized protein n=1 Tax=Cannabis sativa TaxID=3483 RepID=A0A803RCC9_CANSA